MPIPNFFVTPLTTTVCCTCAKWEGARVLQDGDCHSLSEAFGYCRDAADENKKHLWQLPIKKAPEAACETWSSMR